jgi:hypothetical protein
MKYTDRFVRAAEEELSVNTIGSMICDELVPPVVAEPKAKSIETFNEPRILDAPFLRKSTQPFDVSGNLLGVQLGDPAEKSELYIYNIKTESVIQTIPTPSSLTVVKWCENTLFAADKHGMIMCDAKHPGTMIAWCMPNVQSIFTLAQTPAALTWSPENLQVHILPSACAFTLKSFGKPGAVSVYNHEIAVGHADGSVILHDLRMNGKPLRTLSLNKRVACLSVGNTGVMAADCSGRITVNGRGVLDVGAKVHSLVSTSNGGAVISTGKLLEKHGTGNAVAKLTQKPWSSGLTVEKVYNMSHSAHHVSVSGDWLVAARPEQKAKNGALFIWKNSNARKASFNAFAPLIR